MIAVDELASYRPAIVAAISQVVGDRLDPYTTDDLVQSVFLEAIEHAGNGGELTAEWLRLRARARALNMLKSAEWNRTESFEEWYGDADSDDSDKNLPPNLLDLDTPEGLYYVRESVEGLPDEDREIIEMLVDGVSQEEIASEMGVDQGTISRRLAKIREKLDE